MKLKNDSLDKIYVENTKDGTIIKNMVLFNSMIMNFYYKKLKEYKVRDI